MSSGDYNQELAPANLQRFRNATQERGRGEPTLFMHLTKTAGGTLKDAFARAYSSEEIQFVYGPTERRPYQDEASPNLEVVFGHFGFGFHDSAEAEPKYAAILRDPITRNISHYNHLKNVDRSHAGDKARDSANFSDYIRKHRWFEFDNFYVRNLSGIGRSVPFGKITKEHRNIACDNLLRYFSFVGSFEDLPNTTESLGRFLGRDIVLGKIVNKGQYSPPGLDDRILSLNISVHDLYLYALAREAFSWNV